MRMVLLIALLASGCSKPVHEDMEIWTSTNAPVSSTTDTISNPHRIFITADDAPLQEVIHRIGKVGGLKVRVEPNLPQTRCTLRMDNVEPIAALESILERVNCYLVESNGTVIVKKGERNP